MWLGDEKDKEKGKEKVGSRKNGGDTQERMRRRIVEGSPVGQNESLKCADDVDA